MVSPLNQRNLGLEIVNVLTNELGSISFAGLRRRTKKNNSRFSKVMKLTFVGSAKLKDTS